MKLKKILCMTALLVIVLTGCGAEEKDNTVRDSIISESTETLVSQEESILSGTGEIVSASQEMADVQSEISESNSESSSKVLIAYFSVPENVETTDAVAGASIVVRDNEKLGNTEYVARLIQQTIGGDLFRIETVEAYPLDHDPLVDLAAEEQDADKRPELMNHVENFE